MEREVSISASVRARVAYAAVGLATFLSAGLTRPQDCPNLVGRVPYGPTRAVDAVGDLVYYGSGSVLMITDVSVPNAPIVVGELQMPHLIQDIEVASGLAHVVCGFEGYAIADVTNPSAPVLLGRYSTGPLPGWAWAGGVTVSGDLAFVADGNPGLTILNVSDPSAIRTVGEVMVLNSYAVEVRGSLAYLTGYDGIAIVDISDPVWPVVAGTAPGEGYGLAVVGDYAYVGGYTDGLRVYDISNPGAPVEVNTIGLFGGAIDVAAENGLLYLVNGYNFFVLDIVDPVEPSIIGEIEAYSFKVAVDGNHGFLAGHDRGLSIVDVGDPALPTVVGGFGGVNWTLSVAATESLMVAPGSGANLRIFDVTRPENPVQIGVAETQSPFWDLAIVGNYVYTATSSSARIIDVSDPTAPVDVGSMGREATGFAISDGYLYLASYDARLTVMDISNPGSPSYRGHATLPDSARKVAVTNGHAYVPVSGHGLQIVDVGDPVHPSLVGSFDVGDYSYDVASAGSNVFVAGSGGLRILDVANPVAPVQIALYDPDGGVSAVNVAGNHAYVGVDPLHVLDISDPSHPAFVGELDSLLAPGAPEQVKVVGDLIYLAHYLGGVSIVRGCHAIFVDGFEGGDTSSWTTVTAD